MLRNFHFVIIINSQRYQFGIFEYDCGIWILSHQNTKKRSLICQNEFIIF